MVIVWLHTCTQFTPSAEPYSVKLLPLRVNFTQYGSVPLPPTEPTSASDQPEGSAVTVNTELFADWLFTVTENDPEVAPDGISTSRMLTLQPTTVALVPLRDTVLVPCVVPKPDPVICTTVPTGPLVGEIAVIAGAWA